jgi:BTB And C-terminal Kelch
LKAAALTKIVSTFPLASKTEGFALLDERQLMHILSDDNVVDCDESVVFDAVSSGTKNAS